MGFRTGSIGETFREKAPIAPGFTPFGPFGKPQTVQDLRGGGQGGGLTPEQLEERLSSQRRQDVLRSQAFRQQREQEFSGGEQRARKIFGIPGAGGPDSRASVLEGEAPELKEAFELRRQNLQGFTDAEREAFRAQALGGIQQNTAGQLRQLRGLQAQAGLQGGLASAQQLGTLQQGAEAERQAQEGLFLQEAGLRREALGQFESSAEQAQRRRFQEALAIQAGGAGEASLGAAERGAVGTERIGLAQAQALAAQSQGGGKK